MFALCKTLLLLSVTLEADVSAHGVLALFHLPLKENFITFEPLLRALAERGHHVTAVSHFQMHDPPKFYRELLLQANVSFDHRSFENESRWSYARRLFSFAVDCCRTLLDCDLPLSEYDVVLYDASADDCPYRYAAPWGSPVVALYPGNFPPWSDRTPALARRGSFSDRLERIYLKFLHRFAVQIPERMLFKNSTFLADVVLRLVNSHSTLRDDRGRCSNSVDVAGLHFDSHSALEQVSIFKTKKY